MTGTAKTARTRSSYLSLNGSSPEHSVNPASNLKAIPAKELLFEEKSQVSSETHVPIYRRIAGKPNRASFKPKRFPVPNRHLMDPTTEFTISPD
jgi:hypothetical protein